jgi:hypothetical protein
MIHHNPAITNTCGEVCPPHPLLAAAPFLAVMMMVAWHGGGRKTWRFIVFSLGFVFVTTAVVLVPLHLLLGIWR